LFGAFSGARNFFGVRTTPLGSLSLSTGAFTGGEIFRNGAFRLATKAEHARQLSHQWLLDYGIDGLIYAGVKSGLWIDDVEQGYTQPNLGFNFE
jgi:hypothetical protein